jgi:hypothetical protein
MPMPTKRSSAAKKTAQKKAVKTGKRRAVARKSVTIKKLKAAVAETLPTTEQVEEIENKLRSGAIEEMEPVKWPKTKKEIQESLTDYKEKVKWARMRGAKDKIEPEAYVHTIQKLEELLKHSK